MKASVIGTSARQSAASSAKSKIAAFVAGVRRLARARSLDEVMAVATPVARELLAADGVTFVLRDGELCYYADEHAVSPLWKGRRFPMDACISGWCMRERRSVRISDIYRDNRIPHDVYRQTFVRSLAMAPVCRDEPIAAMGAYWAKAREISGEDMEILQTTADASALAIANAAGRSGGGDAQLARQEGDHRVKNVFAMTLSLLEQTRAESVDEFRHAVTERLRALEAANAVLSEAPGSGALLGALLEKLVQHHASRIRVSVDDGAAPLRLSGDQATDVALLVHELCTNSVKHGALSAAAGSVALTCTGGERGLTLCWRESGGPPVRPPSRTGFGTRLIRLIVERKFDGDLRLDYAPSGFACRVLLSLGRA